MHFGVHVLGMHLSSLPQPPLSPIRMSWRVDPDTLARRGVVVAGGALIAVVFVFTVTAATAVFACCGSAGVRPQYKDPVPRPHI